VFERRLGDLRTMMIPAGVLIVADIVLPWYLVIYWEHGWLHIKEFFVDENLMRYAEPVGAPRRGLLFYVPVLLSDAFPWSLLLPVAVAAAWPAFRRRGSASDEDRAQRILVIWIAAIVAFFTFSSTKQDLYIFPAVPAELALVGMVLARGGGRWSVATAAAVAAAVGAGLLALVLVPVPLELAGSLAVSLVVLVGGAAALIIAWRAGRHRVAWSAVTLAATFATLSWVFVLVTLPDFERYKPVAPLAEVIKERASADARIGYYRFALPSMAFYLQRPIFEYSDPELLRQAFESGVDVHCLMTAEEYDVVRGSLPGPTYVVARRPLFDVKARTLLEGSALPDIVLVSNRP
jgi:4-amino-4-deoxy-L-arabinose transferase-like glycosyltransferase